VTHPVPLYGRRPGAFGPLAATYVCPYADPGGRQPDAIPHIRRFADLPVLLAA
jgi:hypothetical protein